MGNALRKNVAVFHQVPAKGVDALGALPHQEIAGAEHDAVRLLLFGFDRNKAHARPRGRFTDGLCIGRIVLLPLDERLDVARRDQAHIMTQLSDLTRPVVRPGTGFHRDHAPGWRCEETEKLRASDALAKEHMPGAIRSMYLEHVLRDVQPDRANLLHGRLLRWQFDICGRPLSGKGKRWGRCCAWSDAVICPAFDAAGRQPPACMGVRGPGPNHPQRARSTVESPGCPIPVSPTVAPYSPSARPHVLAIVV